MLHIKKIVLFAFLCGFLFTASAQTPQQDYNNIKPFTGNNAFRKFSIGINVGALNPSVITGGTNNFYNNQTTLGYGANIRYQFNHYIALQADYLGGTLKGNQNGWPGVVQPAVSSFKTNLGAALDLTAVFTFGNINFLKIKNSIIPYISAGLGTASYKVKIVKAGSTTEEDFDNGNTENNLFVPVGAGLKFNLSQLMNLDLGYRMNFVDKDNLDGYTEAYHKDKFSYGFIGLEFSLGNQQKPRMLFDNPVARLNNNLQTQIDTVTNQVKGLSTDSDGDGVADRFDTEPNTPTGCPVDAHGVSRDTDGDGVPDCKDKELVTPTQCQPVDADGVGKCPEPDCCKAIRDTLAAMNACNLNLPSITFRANRTSLSSDAKAMLATVASQMKSSANCKIVITGYPAASKASQANCNKRLQEIQSYLTETEGISADRIQTNCQVGGGDVNTVDILAQ
jgi:opacity protein-like surface antigen/outer membrane protein OmpA-like peptidoglycan-associated protein